MHPSTPTPRATAMPQSGHTPSTPTPQATTTSQMGKVPSSPTPPVMKTLQSGYTPSTTTHLPPHPLPLALMQGRASLSITIKAGSMQVIRRAILRAQIPITTLYSATSLATALPQERGTLLLVTAQLPPHTIK